MFCKHCGHQMDDIAVICVNCGAQKGTGVTYCQNCGHEAIPGAYACTNCGAALNTIPVGAQQKSKICAGLLGIFLGAFGVHNFYLGYTGKAVAQLLITLLSCFVLGVISEIWGLVEGIMILTGSTTVDGNGVPLKD